MVSQRRAGEFELAGRLQRDRAAPLSARQRDRCRRARRSAPSRTRGHAFEQRADAARPRTAAGADRRARKPNFSCSVPIRQCSRRLAAGGDVLGQLLHRRDRRVVGVSGVGHRLSGSSNARQASHGPARRNNFRPLGPSRQGWRVHAQAQPIAGPVAGWTDIAREGWVARLPRARSRPTPCSRRLDRPIGAWLLFLPGLWSILLARAPAAETIRLILLFGSAPSSCGPPDCVVNDMWDRDMDRKVTRTAGRPLASGRAAACARRCVFLARVAADRAWRSCCSSTGWRRCSGVASLLLVALYPLAKRVTWWPQAGAGLHLRLGAPRWATPPRGRPDRAAWPPLRRRVPVGSSASTRSTPTRTARTTPWSAFAAPRACSAAHTKPFLAACYAARCRRWRWRAGWPGWAVVLPGAAAARPRCWPGRSSRSTSTTRRAACAASSATARRGCSSALAILLGWL